MGDGALKSVEVWRTGQGKLPILGPADLWCALLSQRGWKEHNGFMVCLNNVVIEAGEQIIP